jgi:hypothetical protein
MTDDVRDDVVVVVGVVVVGVVVVGVVVLPDVASASVLLLTASINVTTGGVTMENRPHCSRKARLSALCLSPTTTTKHTTKTVTMSPMPTSVPATTTKGSMNLHQTEPTERLAMMMDSMGLMKL